MCLETLHERHAMLHGCRLSGLIVEDLDIVEVWGRALLVDVLWPSLLALCWLHVDWLGETSGLWDTVSW